VGWRAKRPDTKTIPSGLRTVLESRFALRVMDWQDSNIILGEQMNTRRWDSSRLLLSHKGVGLLRSDGETAAGADVLAVMVRTDYMPKTIGPRYASAAGPYRKQPPH
jgi:DNA segregation ATPase FtsK/SpoIIIE, S-DNA-T family